nr:aminotransferase-like mobile domain-containing protein [Tanacetum cinerariifolium]
MATPPDDEDTIMEERSELMVSPKLTKPIDPTRKFSPFLKPSATSMDNNVKPFSLILSFDPKTCSLKVSFNGFRTLQKGHSVFNLVDIQSDEAEEVLRKLDKAWDKLSRSPSNKVEQCRWMTMFKDSGSEIEHEAFLVLWLSRPNYSDSCGPRFARWEKKKLRVENVDGGFEDFCWRPYAENSDDKFGRWAVVVAMQFGMNQDVPGDVARVNGSREIAWRFYTRHVKDVKVYIPSRVFEPYVTVRYLEWWNKSAGECSTQSPFGDNVTRNFGKNKSRSKRFKVSPKHNKPLQPTHTRAPLLEPSAVKSKPCSFNLSSSPKTSTSKVSFNGFRTLQNGWKDWVNSMHSLHKSTWQKAGIYNAVLNSSYKIIKDDDLILRFAKKWCDETNTFVFEWGEVTITLQDMMVVGGYSVLGQSVVDLTDTETDESKAIIAKLNETRVGMSRSSYTKASQVGWIKMFKDSGSEIEHEAFLVWWLSRFVFPSSYSSVSTNNDVIIWAPLQLLQVWILERFKILSPNCGDSSGPRFARWEKKKISVENVDCGLEDFCWQPYAEDSNDKLGRWAAVGDCLDEELEVAMQFGMNQVVPGDVARVNESPELSWRFYTRPVKDVEVYFPSPISKPYFTTRYLKWWNKSNGGGFLSGAKKEWGLSPKAKVRVTPKAKVRVLHTAQLDVTVSSNH